MSGDDRIAAIVVTFHPRAEYLTNLAKVRAQVDLLILVDNGSAEKELEQIRLAAGGLGAKLIENGRNLGIATALNLGVREAQRQSCRWVALFDQDSVLTDEFVATMIADFQTYSEQRKIMQIVPRYLDPMTGVEEPISRFEDGGVFLTITSGSLFGQRINLFAPLRNVSARFLATNCRGVKQLFCQIPELWSTHYLGGGARPARAAGQPTGSVGHGHVAVLQAPLGPLI